LTAVLMFLSPIFYPVNALPEKYRHWLFINPMTPAIEQVRALLYWGTLPDWKITVGYLACSFIVAWLGFAWFQKTRKGFADVI
jgi:lipopolysaccharide transport system permease protein